jgi:tagaturonate reductase
VALVSDEISYEEAANFANHVIDRFSNPFLEHKWEAIAMNFTSKMQMRNIALIRKLYSQNFGVPSHIALGLAAYILLMNTSKSGNLFTININNQTYSVQDEFSEILFNYWKNPDTAVDHILADERLWSLDLTRYPGLADAVKKNVTLLNTNGVKEAIKSLQTERTA